MKTIARTRWSGLFIAGTDETFRSRLYGELASFARGCRTVWNFGRRKS